MGFVHGNESENVCKYISARIHLCFNILHSTYYVLCNITFLSIFSGVCIVKKNLFPENIYIYAPIFKHLSIEYKYHIHKIKLISSIDKIFIIINKMLGISSVIIMDEMNALL